jgi:hypothetical protein
MVWSETALLSVVSVVNLALTVQALSPGDLGVVALWMSAVGLAGFAAERGLGDVLTVRWLRAPPRLRPAIEARYLQGMAPGLAVGTVLGLAVGWLDPLAFIATAHLWAFLAYRACLFQVLVRRALGRQMALHLSIEGMRSVCLLVLLHGGVPHFGLDAATAALLCYPASHLALLPFALSSDLRLHLPSRWFPRSLRRELWRDRHRLAVAVFKNLADSAPLWLIGALLSTHAAGLFSLVQRLAAFPYGFLRRAETLLMVHFCAVPGTHEFRRAALVQVAAAAALALASALAALCAGPLFPDHYRPALGLFAGYIVVLVPAALTGAMRSRIMAAADYRTLAAHYGICCLIVATLVGGALYAGGGLPWAVAATVTAYAAGAGLIAWFVRRSARTPSPTPIATELACHP